LTSQEKTKALIEIKKETADLVLTKVQHFHNKGELDFPPDYSPANALKSAWLIIQETKDKNNKPALDVCTKASIANALLDMVIQGLNPAKAQCYFIVRGSKLCMDRSYFGTKAVALRVSPKLDEIYAEVVYAGDELEYRIERGRRIIENHTQKFSNVDDSKIVAAYAVAVDKEGEVVRSELMTMDQIKQAWKQSSMKPINDDGTVKAGSAHAKFPGEMAKKTVTSRLAKHFINSSNDSDLIINSIKRTDDGGVEAEAQAEIEEFSNTEVIDITPKVEHQEKETDEMSEEEKAAIMDEEAAEAEEEQKKPGPGF